MEMFADYDHLLQHAQRLFPGAKIDLTYALDDEVIYLDIDGRRFTFEIGSDDESYVFVDGQDDFDIPLMEIPTGFWDFP